MTCTRQSIAPCGDGRSFHTMHRVCTGVFHPPVGDVGNKGLPEPLPTSISKPPQLHSRDLENLACGQVNTLQSLRKDFHFSGHNYGCYCLFLLSTYSFPHPRRTYSLTLSVRPSCLAARMDFQRSVHWDIKGANRPGIQKCVCFSTHTQKPKVNTIKTEEETGTSAKPQCVVECGQCRNVILGRGWGYADHGNRS
jgi:hypothetical protein